MGLGGLPLRSSGTNIVVIILCDAIPMVKSTSTFTKGSFTINLFNTNLVGMIYYHVNNFLGWSQ